VCGGAAAEADGGKIKRKELELAGVHPPEIPGGVPGMTSEP
jgi:hypothetical protein